jgi:hypothetical protein
MNPEILHKLKKVLRVLFLVVVALVLFFVAMAFSSGGRTAQKNAFFPKGFSDSVSSGFESGMPGGVNITLPGMGSSGINEESVFDSNAMPPQAPAPALSASERKLIQNGALSLIVDRVEDAVTKLSSIAEKLGGRIDSVNLDNSGGAAKKRATAVMRVPAVNFGSGMEQAKGIALKVLHENISTEDITEKFIDMQARLKNLRAEETQYLDIMQKAVRIEDVLKVSQRLYMVRQQIEQLQGQMNYLSRQVDMSVITVELSSDPDIEPANVVWSPSTTVKEAVNGLLEGFYGFLKVVIYFAIYLLPLLILYGSVAVLAAWLIWKLILGIKKRVHIDVKKHQIWYNDNILTDNKK